VITKQELCAVCGLPPTTLQNWIGSGLITPTVSGGIGPGNAAKFALMTAAGIAVAGVLHQSDRGCSKAYVQQVMAAFEGVSEDWLREKFSAGRTVFLDVHNGVPRLVGKPQFAGGCEGRPDVETLLKELRARSD